MNNETEQHKRLRIEKQKGLFICILNVKKRKRKVYLSPRYVLIVANSNRSEAEPYKNNSLLIIINGEHKG